MTTREKVIRTKVGLLEMARQLKNVSRACAIMGYSREVSTGSKNSTRRAGKPPSKRSPVANRC